MAKSMQELEARYAVVLAEMETIDAAAVGRDLTAEQEQRWTGLDAEAREISQQIKEHRAELLRASRAQHTTRFGEQPAAPGMGGSLRDTAMRHAEDAVRRGLLNEAGAECIERLMADGEGSTAAAAWAATAGSPAYLRAFAKVVASPTQGHLEWTGEEQEAFRQVQTARRSREERAALTTGGYVLPTSLDPAVMLTSSGSNNPLRQVARVVQTATSTWRGITSAGATAEWKTEGVEAGDGTPAAAEVEIPTFLADVNVTYSYEAEQDAAELVAQLQMLSRDALDNLQATAFATGNGTTAPQGFVTGLAETASEISSTSADALAVADVYGLQNVLPARFSAGASWLSHIATKNTLGQFETGNGAREFPELRQSPPTLLGKPWNECSNMDGAIDATQENRVLAYGDWLRAFVIVDRIGATVEILPAYGGNNRPTAQRHLFITSRHGSEVVVPQAARLLNVT
jgi:HK97 family phage major capsid protein